jgi:hypothetical protein
MTLHPPEMIVSLIDSCQIDWCWRLDEDWDGEDLIKKVGRFQATPVEFFQLSTFGRFRLLWPGVSGS